jgi:cytochrome c-type biogenesis protein CcmH/NrfF
VLHWLINDCFFFGLRAQNWMWVFPAALLLYGAALIYIRSRWAKLRP